MLLQEQKQKKKGTGVFISLTVHAVLVALLFLALTEKRLANDLFARSLITDVLKDKQPEKDSTKKDSSSTKMPEEKKALDPAKKQPTLNQPFVVPAPVVFYGNQAMMNKPVPVSGHSDGKSAFEHTPSALPTPPAPAIAPERTQSINAPQQLVPQPHQASSPSPEPLEEVETHETLEKEDLFTKQEQPIQKNDLQSGEATLLLKQEETSPTQDRHTAKNRQQKKQPSCERTQQAKKLTLADLFKNATSTIASFAQDGLPSARKAGTEGGDDQGSGHQITIKEGDMKYYTLWAKFLNHLNQSARFNRRGKEGMIHNWMNNKEIQYILQCGITVDMQGKILDIEIMVSSGCPGFDKLCISDIRSAVPYPPLPESLGKKTARFEVNVYP